MATFPALVPAPFEFTPGEWPSAAVAAMDGSVAIVRQGNVEVGRELSLDFPNIIEADFLLILNHYRGQRSGFDPFAFSSTTLAADYTPAGHAWRYANPPEVTDENPDVFTVRCQFRSQPRGLSLFGGVAFRSPAGTFLPGAISGGQTPFTSGLALASPATTLTPGRFAVGALWSPTSLPGIELLLDMTDTTARTLVSGAVSQTNDSSGNSRHASQATAGNRPTPGTGSTGVDCISSTSTQYLELAASLGTVRTLLIAAEFTTLTGEQFLVGDVGAYDWHCPVGGATDLLLSPTLSAAAVRDGGGWISGARTAPLAMRRRGRPTLYEFTTTAATTIGQFSADRSNAYRNAGIVGNQYFVIACSGVLSDANRYKLEGWVANRLRVTGDLPAAHPYRATLPLA